MLTERVWKNAEQLLVNRQKRGPDSPSRTANRQVASVSVHRQSGWDNSHAAKRSSDISSQEYGRTSLWVPAAHHLIIMGLHRFFFTFKQGKTLALWTSGQVGALCSERLLNEGSWSLSRRLRSARGATYRLQGRLRSVRSVNSAVVSPRPFESQTAPETCQTQFFTSRVVSRQNLQSWNEKPRYSRNPYLCLGRRKRISFPCRPRQDHRLCLVI